MADQAPAAQSEEAVASAVPTGKSNKLLPLVIALYVVTALGAAALVELVVAPGMAGLSASTHRDTGAGAVTSAGGVRKGDKKKGKEHGGGESGSPVAGSVYLIEDLVVNPAGCGGTRYLAASVGLQSGLVTFLEDMKTKDAPIKDALIQILSAKTVEELADVTKREAIRKEIQSEVDRLLPEEEVGAIYFVRFVLQ